MNNIQSKGITLWILHFYNNLQTYRVFEYLVNIEQLNNTTKIDKTPYFHCFKIVYSNFQRLEHKKTCNFSSIRPAISFHFEVSNAEKKRAKSFFSQSSNHKLGILKRESLLWNSKNKHPVIYPGSVDLVKYEFKNEEIPKWANSW